MKDSQKTQRLFDNAVEVIDEVLRTGEVENAKVVEVAVKSMVAHLKAKNNEVKMDALKFMVNKTILPDEEVLKETLKRTLPEYAGE